MTAHHPKRNAGSHVFIDRLRKTEPLPSNVLAKNRLNREKRRREQRVNKGKAKRTSATGPGPIGKGGLSGDRICTRGHQTSGQNFEDTNDTKRLDHPGGCPGGCVAPDWPQAHHRCLRGRPQSSPSPLLDLPEQTQWHRSGTGSNVCTSTDDPPNSGEAERQQSSGCDSGAPVAVGLKVAHPGIYDTGPPYIISGSLYKDQDGRLATAPSWLTQVCLDGTQAGGTTGNTNPICIRAPGRTSHLKSGSGCIRKSFAAR